jgi:hypothetical protein
MPIKDKIGKRVLHKLRAIHRSFTTNFPLQIKENAFMDADHIRIDSIPKIPPENSTAIINKYFPENEGGSGRIPMVRNMADPDGKEWVALKNFKTNWTHGSDDLDNEIMGGFISQKYGKKYGLRVYDNKNNLIPSYEYYFNYDTGILIFDSPQNFSCEDTNNTVKISVYHYCGKYLSDTLKSH